jgi:hypothetical protein
MSRLAGPGRGPAVEAAGAGGPDAGHPGTAEPDSPEVSGVKSQYTSPKP